MQHLEKETSPASHSSLARCFLSYPYEQYMPALRKRANEDASYISPEFLSFTRDHILPQIEKGTKVTLVGHSAGSVAIEMIKRSLIHILHEKGSSPESITSTLASVVAFHIAPVSVHCAEPDANAPQFTTIICNNQKDITAQSFNPGFKKLLPPSSSAPFSIHTIGKSVILSLNYVGDFSVWGNNIKNIGKIEQTHKGHRHEVFLMRTSATPIAHNLLLNRALHNAVNRQGTMDAMALFDYKGIALPPGHKFSASQKGPPGIMELSKRLWADCAALPVTSGKSVISR